MYVRRSPSAAGCKRRPRLSTWRPNNGTTPGANNDIAKKPAADGTNVSAAWIGEKPRPTCRNKANRKAEPALPHKNASVMPSPTENARCRNRATFSSGV
jgi:hypothetical protein